MTEQEARQLRPGMMVKVVDEWPDDPMILKPAQSMMEFAGKIVTISKIDEPNSHISFGRLFYIEESDTGEYWVSTDFECIVEEPEEPVFEPNREDFSYFLEGA